MVRKLARLPMLKILAVFFVLAFISADFSLRFANANLDLDDYFFTLDASDEKVKRILSIIHVQSEPEFLANSILQKFLPVPHFNLSYFSEFFSQDSCRSPPLISA